MADKSSNTNNNEGTGLNRRNFLKGAGAVVAGSTLGAGLTLSTEAAAAAAAEAPTTITNFKCPICAIQNAIGVLINPSAMPDRVFKAPGKT